MPTIHAYINFKNTCREAMTFYQECLGGELKLTVVKDSPMANAFPADAQDTILHADLTSGDFTLLGSDMQDSTVSAKSGGPVSLLLNYDTKAELLSAFDKLGAGGMISHPVETFFAGSMGNVTDKFGIKWGIFSPEK